MRHELEHLINQLRTDEPEVKRMLQVVTTKQVERQRKTKARSESLR